ncbi:MULTISPECIES: fimbrial protein [Serratia]|uniref:fimbrial protein n=1 Tax=Serratia TaxID=613 RepID=UPI000FB2E47B|nr:fimbrial protein [Serratia liquefaciens]CAI2418868.1 putative fimbrial protein SthD [Serratia liquefaciens]HEJ8087114.1 type 1 fimbrial protein [Serratia liquefaciens]
MKTRIITLALLSAVWGPSLPAAEVTISGRITAMPCTVDASVNQTLDLGKVQRRDLQQAGTGSPWKPFSLTLSSCPPSTSTATVTFTGTPDSADSNAFISSGTATGVALQLSKADGSLILANNASLSVTIDSARKAAFPLAARIYSPKGLSGSGTFSSVVQVNLSYQ